MTSVVNNIIAHIQNKSAKTSTTLSLMPANFLLSSYGTFRGKSLRSNTTTRGGLPIPTFIPWNSRNSPCFGTSVDPISISTRAGSYAHHIINGTSRFSNLPTALYGPVIGQYLSKTMVAQRMTLVDAINWQNLHDLKSMNIS